jgi:ABC-type multidrug transport system fused ATPase/permease subunit
VVLVLLLVSVGLNVLKPWPFALLVDNVLGKKPYPSWAPETVKTWNALTQITAIALALLAVSFLQALCSAVQTYVSTDVGLRGLRRVRNDVYGWLQRLSLHFHRGTAPQSSPDATSAETSLQTTASRATSVKHEDQPEGN